MYKTLMPVYLKRQVLKALYLPAVVVMLCYVSAAEKPPRDPPTQLFAELGWKHTEHPPPDIFSKTLN